MEYREFRDNCRDLAERLDNWGEEYLRVHDYRLYRTYEILADRLSDNDTVLSVGPGPTYIEAQVVKQYNANVTVVERPSAIQELEQTYRRHGIEYVGQDIANGEIEGISGQYDHVIACEVLEHLPLTAATFTNMLRQHTQPGGRLILTTPNVARLYNVFTLLAGKNIYEDDESLFGPHDHPYVAHRREYTVYELREAIRRNGFTELSVTFVENTRFRDQIAKNISANLVYDLLLTFYIVLLYSIPRFRRTIVLECELDISCS